MSRAILFPTDLRCEYLRDPEGIHEPRPRLSWRLRSTERRARGQRQTAWRVIVASSRERLAREEGDLWDSGRVESPATAQIEYGGRAPGSREECWWAVRVWNEAGLPSPWSQPARWSMGLLREADWAPARWIEAPARMDFDRARWLWHPEDRLMEEGARRGACVFRAEFEAPGGAAVEEACMILTADDRFALLLNGARVAASDGRHEDLRAPKTLDLASFVRPGRNEIRVIVENDTAGDPAGWAGKFAARFRDGSQVTRPSNWTWRAAWARGAEEAATLPADAPAWVPARCVTAIGELGGWVDPLTRSGFLGEGDPLILPPVSLFRKVFCAAAPVTRAILHITAQGIYEARINGQPVSEDRFRPGWTDYRIRQYYQTFDVTRLVRASDNVMTVALADGWFAGYVGFHRRRNHYDGERKLRALLRLSRADGSESLVATDASWRVSDEGPWREADLQMGEFYDARREFEGLDDPRSKCAENWPGARLSADPPGALLESHPAEPVRATQILSARAITEPRPGVYIFDMGQNMVGVARARVTGPRGARIRLRFAEALDEKGELYTASLRGARATDTYIKAADATETWAPRFTFHGFRFVEITGLGARPELSDISGVVLRTAMPSTGRFRCSSPMVNRLYENIRWSQRGNYLEVPTDCPQRDERLGWTGDAQIFFRAGSYNYESAAFFTKWLRDLFDTQGPHGGFKNVAPNISLAHNPEDTLLERSCAGWQDAAILCPYLMNHLYADHRILERHYAAMARYLDHLAEMARDGIQPESGFGDWLSLEAGTPRDLLATAYAAHVARLLSEIAARLNHADDARRFREFFESTRAAFQRVWLDDDGRLLPAAATQTACALALRYDLLAPARRSAVFEQLVEDLRRRDYHFSTGFLGLKELLPALSDGGRHDLACRLLLNEDFPSWGYQIRHGATTIWERWDGWTVERGFQNPEMNSFNHYAFGAVGEWLFGYLCGIEPLSPGYAKIRVWPRPGAPLSEAAAVFRSPAGLIACAWRKEERGFRLRARIPHGATAEILLPAGDPGAVTESGRALGKASGVRNLEPLGGALRIEAGSGGYDFLASAPWPREAPAG